MGHSAKLILWEYIFEISPIQSCEDKMKNAIAILAIICVVGIIPSDAGCALQGRCYNNHFKTSKNVADWQTCSRNCALYKGDKTCSFFTYSLDVNDTPETAQKIAIIMKLMPAREPELALAEETLAH